MNAPARLGVFAAILAGVFGLSYVVAGAVVSEDTVARWEAETPEGHDDHAADSPGASDPSTSRLGTTRAAQGYLLAQVDAPQRAEEPGTLRVQILDELTGAPAALQSRHGAEVHLITVRSDGAFFEHSHAERAAAGEDGWWQSDWSWSAAGSYRVFVDLRPAGTDTDLVLSSTVTVTGAGEPTVDSPAAAVSPVVDARSGDYRITLSGDTDLVAGTPATLTARIERGGEPVTDLEPTMGSPAHLIALRDGDLAYLHVHPHGGTPGPQVTFTLTPPSAGRYLLYLDFRHEGQDHRATLVLNASSPHSSEEDR